MCLKPNGNLQTKLNALFFVSPFTEAGDEEEDDDKEGEEQLEKQMGDVDEPYADKMDERMWGDKEDEEEEGQEEEEKKEKKEEFGDGVDQENESQLVANDDNQGE